MRKRLGLLSLGLGVASWVWVVGAFMIMAYELPRDVPLRLIVGVFLGASLLGLIVGIVDLVRATRQGLVLPTLAVVGTYVSGLAVVVTVAGVVLALLA